MSGRLFSSKESQFQQFNPSCYNARPRPPPHPTPTPTYTASEPPSLLLCMWGYSPSGAGVGWGSCSIHSTKGPILRVYIDFLNVKSVTMQSLKMDVCSINSWHIQEQCNIWSATWKITDLIRVLFHYLLFIISYFKHDCSHVCRSKYSFQDSSFIPSDVT